MEWFLITVIFSLFMIGGCNVISGPKETVKGGEYIYYNMTSLDSYIYLQLTSISGDCDLYVSQKVNFPTFSDYTLQSATCGDDFVIITKRSKGPVHIGVYGHPAYDVSECLLNVCIMDAPIKIDEFKDELTELSELSETVIEQNCKEDATRKSSSYFNKGFERFLYELVASIETDSFILELINLFAQVII